MGEWDEITQIRARPAFAADQILLVDADPTIRQWFREAVAGELDVDEVDSGEAALEWIAAGGPRLVVVGRQLTDMTGAELLERAAQWLGERGRPISTFLLADATGAAADVDESRIRIFYRLVPTMQAARVRELLAQASAKLPPKPPVERDPPPEVVAYAKKIGEENELTGAANVAAAAAQQLVAADRVRCLFCDEDTGALWAEGEEAHEAQASVGIAGFAVRTVATIAVPHAAGDALFRKDLDDPQGTGRERLLVQPVAGLDGHVHAVLIAVRHESRPPFGPADIAIIEALATAWAPYLQQLAMRIEADNILGDKLEQGPSDMFRNEAIMHLVRRGARGDVVRVHPGWVRAAYWLVLASLAGAITFVALAHVHQYAEGPAIIQITGNTDVVSYESGTISALQATQGQRVKRDQILARLYDADQVNRLRGLQIEYENKLVTYLQTPGDPNATTALAQARSQRDTALVELSNRVIRAPTDGKIKEVLVRAGQRVDAGKVVVRITKDGTTGVRVLAFLPGNENPRLREATQLTLTLPGYRGARFSTEITRMSEAMDEKVARAQYIGEGAGTTMPMGSSVTIVEGTLPSTKFRADNQDLDLSDGMIGVVEVQLASHTLLETMIPGLQR